MKKYLKISGIILALLTIIYFLGPRPETPTYNTSLPTLSSSSTELEAFVKRLDAGKKIKPGNEAEIVWADSSKKKTKVAVLYLHGFSASQEEGNPVHREFAKRFGTNLYLARLYGHGIDTTDALADITAEKYWESAKQAYVIAKQLGDEVIIMSTSTGGTLALKLAATYPEIKALINLSPNIAINDPAAFLTNNHWGLQLTRLVTGGNYRSSKVDTADAEKYWYYTYRCEAVPALEELIETSMNKKTFEKVKCPVLTVCYYKDEENQDPTVKVSAMREMMKELGTPANEKVFKPLPGPQSHVIGNPLKSKDVRSVQIACDDFAERVLKLEPVVK